MSERVYDEINSVGHGIGCPRGAPGGCWDRPRLGAPYLSVIDEPVGVRGGYGNSNLIDYTNGCDADMSFHEEKAGDKEHEECDGNGCWALYDETTTSPSSLTF